MSFYSVTKFSILCPKKDQYCPSYASFLLKFLKPFLLTPSIANTILQKKFIFSAKAHFRVVGYFNKLNSCLWSSENPRVVLQKSMHPSFVQNEAGATITVNVHIYRTMITNFFFFFFCSRSSWH